MQHELLIEPYIIGKFLFHESRVKMPTDSCAYSFELLVENRGHSDFPGGTINNIRIFQSSISFEQTFGKKLNVPKLGPKESEKILVSEKIILPQSGLYWIDCEVTANDGKEIALKQRMLNGEIGDGKPINANKNLCRNPLLVLSSFQKHQKRTNYLLLILTFLSVIVAIVVALKI